MPWKSSASSGQSFLRTQVHPTKQSMLPPVTNQPKLGWLQGTGYVQDGGQDISFDLYAQCIQLSGAACEVVGKGHLSTLARQVAQGAAWSNISLLTSSATTQPHYRVVRRHASRWFLSDPLQVCLVVAVHPAPVLVKHSLAWSCTRQESCKCCCR